MSKKFKIFLVGCVLTIMCCIGLTAGASENAKAEVVAHNLTITDKGINVNFYVDIQGDVQITLNDTEVAKPEKTEKIVIDAKAYDCYKFTQPVVAKEMDKDVSLVIKSGDEPIVEDNYCVNDYAASVINEQYNNFKYEELVKAMTYYGDFAETYLNYEADKADAEKAAEFLGKFDDEAQADLVSLKYAIDKYEIPEELGIAPAGIQLNLISEVSIRLSFTVTDDKALDYEFTAVSGDVTKELGTLKKGYYNGAAYYYVDIENIGADELDAAYTIKVSNTTVLSNCSALSYARAVVSTYENNAAKADLVNLAKALYLYNKKAETYVASQATAVFDIFYGSEGFSATPGNKTAVYYTTDGDVTREATGNTEITKLSDLNGKNIRGCSVWMDAAYPVSGTEEISGPYVIRRYENNKGSLLDVSGTATFTATVDANTGDFAARYPGVSADEFTISEAVKNEVAVSGTLNVTGNAKTGVITVASDATANIVANDLVSKEQVILASHKGVNLSGNADVSAITLLDDGMGHFDIVKHNDNVRVASVICVCGDDVTGETSHDNCPWAGTNGIAAVYDINWEPHTVTTATGTLPGLNASADNPKYYYLTQGFTLTNSVVTGVSHLDLNGQTITGSTQWNIQLQTGANYSISDSQEDGKIQLPQDFEYNWVTGGLIKFVNPNTIFKMYGGILDMSKVSTANNANLIDVNASQFFMYGGEIKPAKTKITQSNCIGVRGTGRLSVTGGTIYGEVFLKSESDTLVIANDANVGVPLEGTTGHGIFAWDTDTSYTTKSSVICDNLNKDAKIYIQKDSVYITLSEAENSNSKASGFTLVNEGKDGHYGVVKKLDGTLAFATTICACGKNVSDDCDHTCPWVTEQGKGIQAVYDIDWKAHTANNILPGLAKGNEDYYYLETNVTLSSKNSYTAEGTHLDLNGKSVICTYTGAENIISASGTSRYSISDSKGEGAIRCASSDGGVFTSGSNGAIIRVYNTGCKFIMYSGTIDMTNSRNVGGGKRPIEICGTNPGGNTFIMYGGVIKPSQDGYSIHVRGTSHLEVSGDATIYGQIEHNSTGTIKVGESAKVGLQWKDFAEYGIEGYTEGTSSITNRQIYCNNLDENAEIVVSDLITKLGRIVFSEMANSHSVLSNINVADGHAKVIKENDSLSIKSVICVCGKNVSEHEKPCAWTEENGGVEAIYDIPWQAYTTTTGLMPGYATTGYYYLKNNLTLNGNSEIKVTSYLDLNGKTITCNDTSRNISVMAGGMYSIADSKGNGTIVASENHSVIAFGGVIYVTGASTLNMYGGTINLTKLKAAEPYGSEALHFINIEGGSTYAMYGGEIQPAQNGDCIGVRGSTASSVSVTGGTIYGKILLQSSFHQLTVGGDAKVGLPMDGIASNGIDAWDKGTKLISADATDKAEIIIVSGNFNLSGTGELSAFKAPKDFEIIKTGDQLSMQVIGAQ